MVSFAIYHCECRSASKQPRRGPPPTTEHEYWQLQSLYFCEECDAIKCSDCVTEETAVFYCPLCLFEVPTASVRGEQLRCARNCFECPTCSHSLSVVAADPLDGDEGLPRYILICQGCRWDSKEVGIVFDKPTGLAGLLYSCLGDYIERTGQLQKQEAASTGQVEFDRIKEHFQLSFGEGSKPAVARTPAQIPRSTSLLAMANRSRAYAALGPRTVPMQKDEIQDYISNSPARDFSKQEADRIETMRNLTSLSEIAPLEKRALSSWEPSLLMSQQKPQRILLQAKRTKRCPECKHIIVKPDPKATSIKYRIKLVASNYLPAIQVYRRPPVTVGSRLSVANSASVSRRGGRQSLAISRVDGEEPLRQGRAYSYELAFVNPLYEAIHVKVEVFQGDEPLIDTSFVTGGNDSSLGVESAQSTPAYTLHLPAASFPIGAFAEQWEYEDNEDDSDRINSMETDSAQRSASGSQRRGQPGVLEKKANRTTVLLDLNVGKEANGVIRAYLFVTYTYAADQLPTSKRSKGADDGAPNDLKTFSFWAQINLGIVVPLTSASTSTAKSRLVSSQRAPIPEEA